MQAEAASDASNRDDEDLFDQSDASDEDLFDDEDDAVAPAVTAAKPAAAASGTVLDAADSDSDSDSDSIASFDDGYTSDLMGDEADQGRLEAMSELEREAEIEERRRQREAGRTLVSYRREKQQRARKLKGSTSKAAAAAHHSASDSDESFRGGGRRRLRVKARSAAADESSGSEEEAEWDHSVQKREKAKQRALKRKKAAYTDMQLDDLDAEYEAAFSAGVQGGGRGAAAGPVDTELEAELLAELGDDEDISDTEAARRQSAAQAAAEALTPGVLWKYGLLTRAWLTRHIGWDYFKDAIPGLFVRFSVPSSAAARGFASPSGRVLGIITRVVRGAQYNVKLEAGAHAKGTQFISTRRLEVWAPQVNARPMPLKVTEVSGPVGLHAKYKYAPPYVQQAKQVAVLRAELKAWADGMRSAAQGLPTGADVRQRRQALAATTRGHTPSAAELSRSARAHRLGVDVGKALHLTNLHETLRMDTLKLREMLKEEYGMDVPDGMVMPLSKGHGMPEAAAALHTELRLVSNKLLQVKAEQEHRREAARAQVAVLSKISRETALKNRKHQEEVIRRQRLLARDKAYQAVQAADPTIRRESAPRRMWHTGSVEELKAEIERKKAEREAADVAATSTAGGEGGGVGQAAHLPEEAKGLGLGGLTENNTQNKALTAVEAERALLARAGRGGGRGAAAKLMGGSAVEQLLASTEQELSSQGLSLRPQRSMAAAGVPLGSGAAAPVPLPAGSSSGSGGAPLSFAQLKAKRAAAKVGAA